MNSYDFDLKLQAVFTSHFSDIQPTDWKRWLDISSQQEYESTAFKLSDMPSDTLEKTGYEKTDPKSFSVNSEIILNPLQQESKIDELCRDNTCFFGHTSGTSTGEISKLKWFLISKPVVKRLWAPGMQAIFESSGLTRNSSAVIFVPSRIRYDGLINVNNKKFVSLYTSEFSQRLVLSLIMPHSYLIDEYRNARNLSTISKLLSMTDISVVSAPASTLLGWADLSFLRHGLTKSMDLVSQVADEIPVFSELKKMIDTYSVEKASVEIQERLSKHLSDATIIFSTTGLSAEDWLRIRSFLKWKKNEEKYTNLYVGSEIGPFAASIDKEEKNNLSVFPLTIAIIDRKGTREIISRSRNKFGRLLVSRMDSKPLVNIDSGDMIIIEDQQALPKLNGEILRSEFEIPKKAIFPEISENSRIFAGDYFDLGKFEIINPRQIIADITKEHLNFELKKPIFLITGDTYELILPVSIKDNRIREKIVEKFNLCTGTNGFENISGKLKITAQDRPIPFQSTANRSRLLEMVRRGDLPKGILKIWPFYVVVPAPKIV